MLGDASILGWTLKTGFRVLIREMLVNDRRIQGVAEGGSAAD
jgi:hypothetical protein